MTSRSHVVESLESRCLLDASAHLAKEFYVGPANGVELLSRQSGGAAGNGLVLLARDSSGVDPWYFSPATGQARKIATLRPGFNSQADLFTDVTFGGKSYICYADTNDGTNFQVYQWDMVNAPVARASYNGRIRAMKFVGGQLFYFADSSQPALYSLGATGAPTPRGSYTYVQFFDDTVDGKAIFYGKRGNSNALWRTDGGAPAIVHDFGPDGSVTLDDAAIFTGDLYFSAYVQGGISQVWATDGNTAVQITEVDEAGGGLNPSWFTASSGALYFLGLDPATGYDQIWKIVNEQATMVTHFQNVGFSSFAYLTDLNGQLCFTFRAPAENRPQLYKLVGSSRVFVDSTGVAGGNDPSNLVSDGSNLFFRGDDLAGLPRVYQSDGSSIKLVSGDAGTYPGDFIRVGSHLYYSAFGVQTGSELYAVDLDDSEAVPVNARLKANSTSIDEGGLVDFQAVPSGGTGTYKFYFDLEDGNGLRPSGPKPSTVYLDNLPDDAPRRVRVKIVDSAGNQDNAYLNITVRNVAPKITKVLMPATFVSQVPMPFKFVIKDPGVNDTVKATASWGGDIYPVINGQVSGTHVFSRGSVLTNTTEEILITAADKDGADDGVRRSIALKLVMHTDATMEALGVPKGILVSGTRGADRVKIQKDPTFGVRIFVGATDETVSLGPGEIINVALGDGNDRLEVASAIVNSVFAEGGAGNDTLGGAGGRDFLRGGLGNDKFLRTPGGDRLIA